MYETPLNLVELLNEVVRTSAHTILYADRLVERTAIRELADFAEIPVTPLATYRKQRLADVLAQPSRVEWIVGPYRGQSAESVAVAEGPEESENRYEVLADIVKQQLVGERAHSCAVVTSGGRRYFAAEIATILSRAGVPSHLFPDAGTPRTYELLDRAGPDLLVVLSDRLAEADLPPTIELCVTFRRSHQMQDLRQLDVYVVDELGFLAQSTDCQTYTLNNDVYYFERSNDGYLVVTALYNKTRPVLRIKTQDRVSFLQAHTVEFTELAAGA